jgi:hypothetical protein
MPLTPIERSSEVAKSFVKAMKAFHTEPNALKGDEIVVRQLHAPREFNRSREKKLSIHDIEEMFAAMKDHASRSTTKASLLADQPSARGARDPRKIFN